MRVRTAPWPLKTNQLYSILTVMNECILYRNVAGTCVSEVRRAKVKSGYGNGRSLPIEDKSIQEDDKMKKDGSEVENSPAVTFFVKTMLRKFKQFHR